MATGQTNERVCSEIITAVAKRENVDPEELPEPVYSVINPDALTNLFRGDSGRVTFDYLGYRVTVDHEHNVEVVSVTTSPP